MEEPTDRRSSAKKTEKKVKKTNVKGIVAGVLIVVLAATSVYFWNVAREAQLKAPEAVAQKNQEESKQVISELQKLIELKQDEKPTVAKIEDPEVLKKSNKDFYTNAKAGDYLILYPERAIIFRLDEKKIINIAPIINTSNLKGDSKKAE